MAVAFDAVGPSSAGTGSSTSPLTWSHTDGALATAIVAAVTSFFGSTNDVTAVSYGGNALALQKYQASGTTGSGGIALYELDTALTGANTVSASFATANSHLGGSISFTGSSGKGTPVSAFASAVSSVSVSVPSTTTGGMIAAAACVGSTGTYSGTNGVTVRWSKGNSGGSASDNAMGGTVASTGGGAAQTVGFSATVTDDWGIVAVELLPAAGAAAGMVPQPARRIPYRTMGLPPQRRFRQMLPVPGQLNPPYPFTEIAQRREAWARGLPRRGRVTVVVPAQLNPPYPFTETAERRETWARGMPRRGRITFPVPAQLNPPYPFTEVRQQRQPRGLWPRRGRDITPVPAQQGAVAAPAFVAQPLRHARLAVGPGRRRGGATVPASQDIVPQTARRGRVVLALRRVHPPVTIDLTQATPPLQRPAARPRPAATVRRGRDVTPVPAQVNPPWPAAEVRQGRQPRGFFPFRGRRFETVPAQQAAAQAPAWVQGHRVPVRAITLLIRRGRAVWPPQTQTAAPPPPWVQSHRGPGRPVTPGRRGHVAWPAPAQDQPVPHRAPARPVTPPRHGRIAQTPQTQAPAPPPPWVQAHRSPARAIPMMLRRGRTAWPAPAQDQPIPHRAPARAIALIRRRFRQLIPWPQAARPAFSVGTLTAQDTAGGTLTAGDRQAGGPS